MTLIFRWYLFFSLGAAAATAFAQDLPSVPPALIDSLSKDNAGLADLMKTDILKRLVEAQKDQAEPGKRIRRPRPISPGSDRDYEPVDLSKYIGTEGDPQKAYEKLQELGKVPPSSRVPEPLDAPMPQSASKEALWKDVPFEKRMKFVEDLLDRRKFHEGLTEVERLLNTEPEPDKKISALVLREKLLLKDRRYKTVEQDYFRLRGYFPEEEQITELKTYIEQETGLQPLMEAVKSDPSQAAPQRALLDRYLKYNWLDFAEEFFAETIEDTSKPTIESLSEIYYRKQDYPMLVKLSSTAQTLHPNDPVFLYNEAVGVLNEQDSGAKDKALELLQKAHRLARTPSMQSRIDWYLERLQPKGK